MTPGLNLSKNVCSLMHTQYHSSSKSEILPLWNSREWHQVCISESLFHSNSKVTGQIFQESTSEAIKSVHLGMSFDSDSLYISAPQAIFILVSCFIWLTGLLSYKKYIVSKNCPQCFSIQQLLKNVYDYFNFWTLTTFGFH